MGAIRRKSFDDPDAAIAELEVSRLNKDALITLDKLRVDVVGLFHIKVKPDGLNNDLHASPEYRAHLITVMAKRAVEAALK